MFDTPVPIFVDPRKLCDSEQTINGFIELNELKGLCSYIETSAGKVEVQMHFARDQQHRPVITGEVLAKGVGITCQRCLQVAEHELHCDLNVAVVLDESQAEKLPAELDAWIVEDGQLNIRDALDQELILSLPIVPYHQDCKVEMQYGKESAQQEAKNPFGELASLLKKD